MSAGARDRALTLKTWEVTAAAWDAFESERATTNGVQAAYDAGLRDARERALPDREALSALALSFLKPPQFAGGSWTLNPVDLADAILDLLNGGK